MKTITLRELLEFGIIVDRIAIIDKKGDEYVEIAKLGSMEAQDKLDSKTMDRIVCTMMSSVDYKYYNTPYTKIYLL